MREIAFKAKEKYDGDWVEGLLSKCDGEYVICDNSGTGVFIDPDTICQYTGLTDKNGNKIWENDVVTIKGMISIGKVLFDKESCSYSIRVGAGRYVRDIGRFAKEIEVIGNIFDNPELLKGE